MGVRIEPTPNPNAMKFSTDSIIFEGTNSVSVMPGDISEYAVLNDLMKLDGVDNVFGYQNFITVNKKFDVEWESITSNIQEVITKHGF
ncbi:NifU N-terminal domain-containing protein [Oceanobacillus chungangensis]|uniref:Scaffolding protein n=1 Tax=Oceanobacillus chungangensis TaxID=1229152 RepID=A0A3D8PXR9_9BACI|nr:NifU N-terminal domain-containing protein [Oceanobacillus chungangensis]RDW19939.1 scaffolding protein [Oceanobacillus chungangensis]